MGVLVQYQECSDWDFGSCWEPSLEELVKVVEAAGNVSEFHVIYGRIVINAVILGI
jgi:hypothetical protein